MKNVNVYLSSISPNSIKFLIELLEYTQECLKTSYYEADFVIGKEGKNELEVTRLKEITEILPYLESIFKNRRIKDNKVDEKTTKYVINKIYDGLKTNKIKIEDDLSQIANIRIYDNIKILKNDKIKLQKNDDSKNIKMIYNEVDFYNDDYSKYFDNKKNLKKYFTSKKGTK